MSWRAGKAEAHGTMVMTDTGGLVARVLTFFSSEKSYCASPEEAHRRAVLMAAAPDLLEALQEFVSCRDEARSIDDGVPNSSALAWTALRHRLERLESASRALILKAIGEQK